MRVNAASLDIRDATTSTPGTLNDLTTDLIMANNNNNSVLDTVVRYGEYVCCSVVFGTLIGVFVFSVMWSELLRTYTISCPLWSSVYKCQSVECAFTSSVRTECGIIVM